MTVTLTVAELESFQAKLSVWYSQRLDEYVRQLDRTQDRRFLGPDGYSKAEALDMAKLMFEWEEKHPRPDWKTLLAEAAN